jgi:MtaA/CmuA family methyltransferase
MNSMTSFQRVMAAMDGHPVDRTPVSLMTMAWAAHYIGKTYREYTLEPETLVASHLALARDLGMDTVTVQTDPWCEAEAYGMQFQYPAEGVGIPLRHLLEGEGIALDKLMLFDPHKHHRTSERIRAVQLYAEQVKGEVPIIGWVEGPIAEYADLRGLESACIDLIEFPDEIHHALGLMVENALRFARAQIEAGADIIGVGDAAASVIGPTLYEEYVWPHERVLLAGIRAAGAKTKLHICGNIAPLLPLLAQLDIDILDVDWMVPLEDAQGIMGETVTLCGNFNPVEEQFQCSPSHTRAASLRCREQAGVRFILQGGCETPPGTPLDNVKACFDFDRV